MADFCSFCEFLGGLLRLALRPSMLRGANDASLVVPIAVYRFLHYPVSYLTLLLNAAALT